MSLVTINCEKCGTLFEDDTENVGRVFPELCVHCESDEVKILETHYRENYYSDELPERDYWEGESPDF